MYSQFYNSHPSTSYDEGAALGLLQHLNKDELQNLLDDEDRLLEIIQSLPQVSNRALTYQIRVSIGTMNFGQVKNISSDKETLIASNKSVAEYNLQREPQLLQSRQQLASLYDRAVALQKEYESYKQKLGECYI
jgi:ESCRT-I complex subunit VPS37